MLLSAIRSKKFVWGFPVAIFSINTALIAFNPPESFWIITSPIFHFLGGAAMAMLFLNFWESRPELYSFKTNFLIVLALSVSFSALVGVLWEHFEFLLDIFFGARGILPIAQTTLADTMADLFLDLAGGAGIAVWYFIASNRSRINQSF